MPWKVDMNYDRSNAQEKIFCVDRKVNRSTSWQLEVINMRVLGHCRGIKCFQVFNRIPTYWKFLSPPCQLCGYTPF